MSSLPLRTLQVRRCPGKSRVSTTRPKGDSLMTQFNSRRITYAAVLTLGFVSLLSTTLVAQTVKVEGLIKSRNGDTMTLQTSDSPNLVVLLTDSTQVGQIQGVFKARRKEMSMAALIPGLAVEVEGSYDEQKQLVAKVVKFKGDDLARAKSIQAGLHETQAQARQTEAQARQNKE